jgi:transposase-like protein
MMDSQHPEKRNGRYLWYCRACGKQYTVRVGTVFEKSHIDLRHWCMAFWRACASKKGVSAKQIQRECQISYKSALFLMHRIRFAMSGPIKGDKLTGIVEADETYIGGKPRFKGNNRCGRGTKKQPLMAVVQRDGKVRTRVIANVTGLTLKAVVREEVHKSARIMTDEWTGYVGLGREFASHETVRHSNKEYARGDVCTNSAESFFALFKRGLHGTFHAVSRQHLHRYAEEFAFRWDNRKVNDGERVIRAIRGAEGKRLLYREPIVA